MSAAEFAFWLDYRAAFGFPADRLEAVAANGAAYVGATRGGRAKPADMLFAGRRPASRESIRAFFDGLTADKFKGIPGVQ